MECYTIYGTKYLDSYNWSILEAFFHWARADIVAIAGTQKSCPQSGKDNQLQNTKLWNHILTHKQTKTKKTKEKEKEKEKGAIHD